jgi:hypothetical protein
MTTMTLEWNDARTHGLRKTLACEYGPYGMMYVWYSSDADTALTKPSRNNSSQSSEIRWVKLIFMVMVEMS